MCVTTSAITSARRLVMDISYPVFYVDQGIIVPFPRKGSKWMGTAVFQTYVRFFFFNSFGLEKLSLYRHQAWSALIASYFLIVFALWAINKITNQALNRSQNSLFFWIFYLLIVWNSQGNRISLMYRI